MNFLEMAEKRYSVRRFDSARKVEKEKIDNMLKAAQKGPSAHNFQSWRVLVLESEEAVAKLPDCTPCHYHAPLAFVVGYDEEACWKREADGEPAGQVDAVIAAVHMMFEAYEQGLGCCWVMGFDEAALRDAYHIPKTIKPVAILVCGYPREDVRPSSRHGVRQELEKLVTYNDYAQEGAV